jgi:hypothetical protein
MTSITTTYLAIFFGRPFSTTFQPSGLLASAGLVIEGDEFETCWSSRKAFNLFDPTDEEASQLIVPFNFVLFLIFIHS